MSDETKGATVIPGCDHKEIKAVPELPGSGFKVCTHCAVPIHVDTWMALHMPAPPPEPPKSWVRRKAEATGRDSDYAERLMRETVEECCRVLAAKYHPNLFDDLRRAMLEPKP